MMRLLYPHDSIPDEVYAEVLDRALASFSGSAPLQELLATAEKALDAQQQQRWIELDEEGQIVAMKAVEGTVAFAAIRGAVQISLYNHPAVWTVLGYEGPSFAKGGYIERGAGVVDWLRQVP